MKLPRVRLTIGKLWAASGKSGVPKLLREEAFTKIGNMVNADVCISPCQSPPNIDLCRRRDAIKRKREMSQHPFRRSTIVASSTFRGEEAIRLQQNQNVVPCQPEITHMPVGPQQRRTCTTSLKRRNMSVSHLPHTLLRNARNLCTWCCCHHLRR